jgi:hypothetical protein
MHVLFWCIIIFESSHFEGLDQSDQMKEYEMGQICSVHRGDEKCIQNLVRTSKSKKLLGNVIGVVL